MELLAALGPSTLTNSPRRRLEEGIHGDLVGPLAAQLFQAASPAGEQGEQPGCHQRIV